MLYILLGAFCAHCVETTNFSAITNSGGQWNGRGDRVCVCVYVIQMDCFSEAVAVSASCYYRSLTWNCLFIVVHQFSYKFYVLSIILWYEYDTFAVAATAAETMRSHYSRGEYYQNSICSWPCMKLVCAPQWPWLWHNDSYAFVCALSACNWSCLSLPCDLCDAANVFSSKFMRWLHFF